LRININNNPKLLLHLGSLKTRKVYRVFCTDSVMLCFVQIAWCYVLYR